MKLDLIDLEETLQHVCIHKCGRRPPNNQQEYQACQEKKCLATIWYDNALFHNSKGWNDLATNNLKRLRRIAGLCGECGQLIQVEEDIKTASYQAWKRRNREASPSDYIICWKCFVEQDKKSKKKELDKKKELSDE